MATLNEITFDLLESIRAHKISDDTDISERQIRYHIHNQRALWLRNEYNKPGRKIDNQIEQDLGCLELTVVDAAECCTITTGCYALRTVKKLPKFLELHSGPAITRVGPVNKTAMSYNFMDYDQAIVALEGKYSKKQIVTLYLNEYIYVLVKDLTLANIDYINVKGVLANPEDLKDFKCDLEGTECYSFDSEYPINNWVLPYIKEQVFQQFGLSLQIPKDTGNDAKEDLRR